MQTLFSSLEKELSREKFMVLSSLFTGKTKVGYKYSVGILFTSISIVYGDYNICP